MRELVACYNHINIYYEEGRVGRYGLPLAPYTCKFRTNGSQAVAVGWTIEEIKKVTDSIVLDTFGITYEDIPESVWQCDLELEKTWLEQYWWILLILIIIIIIYAL